MSPMHLPGAHHVSRTISRNTPQPPQDPDSLQTEIPSSSCSQQWEPSSTAAHPRSRSTSISSSTSSTPNDRPDFTREDTEWHDVDPEDDAGDELVFQSLFEAGKSFESLKEMVEYDVRTHGVDLRAVMGNFGLDFYGTIKLVNYIRLTVRDGNEPALKAPSVWEDDKYLQPVLEDDAVLFSLDELLMPGPNDATDDEANTAAGGQEEQGSDVDKLKAQLEALQQQFADYRHAVEQTLEQRWSDREDTSRSNTAGSSALPYRGKDKPGRLNSIQEVEQGQGKKEDDHYYFESYAYNDIHEIMLRDTVRTEAYRDFMYDHKVLFDGKTVLDVGTGTGILSMFAAKAGASRVWAVDNSSVIEKAKSVIKENGLEKVVKCVKGRIEEVELDDGSSSAGAGETQLSNGNVDKGKAAARGSAEANVDILISEWMGYALLYESMLDSVLHARDRFLKPDGLMAPSHTALRIASFSDPDYIADTFHFWDSVYGFDMRAMSKGIYDEVMVRSVKPEDVVGQPRTFRTLDLHSVNKDDLEFRGAAFETLADRDIEDGLDGFVIWFDAFFLTSRKAELPANAVAGSAPGSEAWPGKGKEDEGLSFTTGPCAKETHWRSACCVIDKTYVKPMPLEKGSAVRGAVSFSKRTGNSRQLDIRIDWMIVDSKGEKREDRRQTWSLR